MTGRYLDRARAPSRSPQTAPHGLGRPAGGAGCARAQPPGHRRRLPPGCLVAVTGVSGSGKSTLVNDILLQSLLGQVHRARTTPGQHGTIDGVEHIDKVVAIDQSPIGRTPRSNPATYTGLFDHVRKLFSQTSEAKVRGYLPGPVLLQRPGRALRGVCRRRHHQDRDALPARRLRARARSAAGPATTARPSRSPSRARTSPTSSTCRAKRRSPFFANQPHHRPAPADPGRRRPRLHPPRPARPHPVGGRGPAGEARPRSSPASTGHTLYVLDEPTTGLHFDDVRKLLEVLSPAGRPGQHRHRHRAQPRRHQDGRLDHRPRARRRRAGRGGGRRRHPRRGGRHAGSYTGEVCAPCWSGAAQNGAARAGSHRHPCEVDRPPQAPAATSGPKAPRPSGPPPRARGPSRKPNGQGSPNAALGTTAPGRRAG